MLNKLMGAVLSGTLLIATAVHAQAPARVFFVEPKDGATVTSPVHVKFGVEGMQVAPAGTTTENTGHHHLLIDGRPAAEGPGHPGQRQIAALRQGPDRSRREAAARRSHADPAVRRRRASFVWPGNEPDHQGACEVTLGRRHWRFLYLRKRGFGRVFRGASGRLPCPAWPTATGRAGQHRYNGRFQFLHFSGCPHVALFHFGRATRVRPRRVARSRGFLARSGRTRRTDRPQRRGQVVTAQDRRRPDEARRRPRHAPERTDDRLRAAGTRVRSGRHRCSTSSASGLTDARALLDEYDEVAHKLADTPEGAEHDALLARMNTLQSSLDLHDAWNWRTRVATTLAADRPGRRRARRVRSRAA